MIDLVKTDNENSFINNGDMLDCEFINNKFNFYSEDKKIDFHLINIDPKMYINFGDTVTVEEVNSVINYDKLYIIEEITE